jgi:hypothetical protein
MIGIADARSIRTGFFTVPGHRPWQADPMRTAAKSPCWGKDVLAVTKIHACIGNEKG